MPKYPRVAYRGVVPHRRSTPDTNRLSGSFRAAGITERSYRRPRWFRLFIGCLNPLPIPYVMQDGTFKQRKGRNKTGHNLTSTFNTETRKARILQSQLYKNNARIQSKQEHNAELQPNKRELLMSTYSGLLTRLAPHIHLHKKQRK